MRERERERENIPPKPRSEVDAQTTAGGRHDKKASYMHANKKIKSLQKFRIVQKYIIMTDSLV